jgi:hypothetical protein
MLGRFAEVDGIVHAAADEVTTAVPQPQFVCLCQFSAYLPMTFYPRPKKVGRGNRQALMERCKRLVVKTKELKKRLWGVKKWKRQPRQFWNEPSLPFSAPSATLFHIRF